jgi:hypothetical protein
MIIGPVHIRKLFICLFIYALLTIQSHWAFLSSNYYLKLVVPLNVSQLYGAPRPAACEEYKVRTVQRGRYWRVQDTISNSGYVLSIGKIQREYKLKKSEWNGPDLT